MKSITIALIRGDGIGKEVIPEAMQIMNTVEKYSDYKFEFKEVEAGGEEWKRSGQSITDGSFNLLKSVDAILLGALGVPGLPQGVAESAVLKIRQEFDQYVNLRPIKLYEPLRDVCPLKEEFIGEGIDMVIVRENSEGIYRNIGGTIPNRVSIDTMVFTKEGVTRILQYALNFAVKNHRSKICSVDKANLLQTSKLWRSIFEELGKAYPTLHKENFYIDAFCQWLLRAPSQFQTVVSSNMFGDIISDEAAYLTGSLGMGASGNINPNPGGISMFEPIHGSAPDIAGKNIANPIAAILSVKLLFEHVLNNPTIGILIENSVNEVIQTYRTVDIYPRIKSNNLKKVTTQQMGEKIRNQLSIQMKK